MLISTLPVCTGFPGKRLSYPWHRGVMIVTHGGAREHAASPREVVRRRLQRLSCGLELLLRSADAALCRRGRRDRGSLAVGGGALPARARTAALDSARASRPLDPAPPGHPPGSVAAVPCGGRCLPRSSTRRARR